MIHTLPPLIVLLGPTAVGKTDLSLGLCKQFQGEVVSADSRQIYRGMDIGTAKPSVAEQSHVPHHLLDIRNPDKNLSVSLYQALSYGIIDDIHRRNRTPFLVGGSALYIRSVVHGLRIPEVPPNPELRAELEAFVDSKGRAALFERLQLLDPITAEHTDPNNPRRVIRALEIFITTGRSKVELEGAAPPPYRILLIGLDRPRAILHMRIDQRVEQMLEQGWIQETERLLSEGYDPQLPAMASFGYREIIAYLQKQLSYADAVEKIKTETHRFVRHQYTWFRKIPNIHWFDLEEEPEASIYKLIDDFLD